MSKGFLYILTNPALSDDMLKIGMTTKNSKDRAWELFKGHTGVPEKFVLSFQIETLNCEIAEQIVHGRLIKYRYNEYREFFKFPLNKAIVILREAVIAANEFFKTKIEKEIISDLEEDDFITIYHNQEQFKYSEKLP